MRIYALAMDSPGRYIVGQSSASTDAIVSQGHVTLHNAAHLTVLKDRHILSPIDVLSTFHASLRGYIGFGELNEEYTETYLLWVERRQNPPDFEVEEGE